MTAYFAAYATLDRLLPTPLRVTGAQSISIKIFMMGRHAMRVGSSVVFQARKMELAANRHCFKHNQYHHGSLYQSPA